jgi:hypothetical protein
MKHHDKPNFPATRKSQKQKIGEKARISAGSLVTVLGTAQFFPFVSY